ncbi:MAG: hypothetical protein ACTHLH_08775 [Solirubrobacterales bacterium]
MTASRRISLSACAVALGLLLPAIATARALASDEAGANIRRSPGDSATFTLAGSNGYSLYFKSEKGVLTIVSSRRRPAQPTISPTGKLVPANQGSSSESTYGTQGVPHDPATISADLGKFGSVSLTFQPSGKKKVTWVDLGSKSEKCIGATKIVRRLGNFVGSVSFRGENGYTEAAAISVPGTVGTSPFRNCTTVRVGGAGARAVSQAAAPEAEAFLSVPGKTSLLVTRDSGKAHFFAASSEELEPGLTVLRTATAAGRRALFSFHLDGTRATVNPPAPFSGAAAYRDPRGGPPSWTGNLSVEFPGFVKPLTGAGMLKPVLRLFR